MEPNAAEYKIGAGYLTLDGDDLGGTTEEGVVVHYDPDIFLHTSGKYGSTPIKASLKGVKLTIEATLGETTEGNLEKVFAGVGAGGKFGGVAGTEITGGELIVNPFDGSEAWIFTNVVPTGTVEVAYLPNKERVYKVTFTALIDPNAVEGQELGYLS